MIKTKDCFEKGLLKKTSKNLDLAKKSLRQAQFILNESEELLELNKKFSGAIILYNAFFHAVRSLLYRDGIKEKSHYCVARYFEEKYINKNEFEIKFLQDFEKIMEIRNEIQYTVGKTSVEEDLDEIFNTCQEFIIEVEKIL